jgi:hypothetical protein
MAKDKKVNITVTYSRDMKNLLVLKFNFITFLFLIEREFKNVVSSLFKTIQKTHCGRKIRRFKRSCELNIRGQNGRKNV